MAYSTTSFAEIKSNLGAKILPFFQAGQLALKDEADAQLHPQSSAIHLEELPRPTFFETMTQPPRQIKYLNSPAEFPQGPDRQWQKLPDPGSQGAFRRAEL